MNELELKKHYICYFDILGFKEFIKGKGEKGEIEFLKILDNAYEIVIRDINTMSKPTQSNSIFKYKIFSDNIIICTENNNIHSLYSLIFLTYLLQSYLIKYHSLFIRGSITEGLLYINDNYVYGSGLIRAYELEKDIAIYPRILLDKNLDTVELNNSYSEKLFCIDGDGYYFIDYLCCRGDDPNLLYEKHKSIIINELNNINNNEKIYQKYLWCREYHNISCKKYNLNDMAVE